MNQNVPELQLFCHIAKPGVSELRTAERSEIDFYINRIFLPLFYSRAPLIQVNAGENVWAVVN